MGRGRKPTVLQNPFIIHNVWGDEENVLWLTEDVLDIRIEDILVGCSRALSAKTTAKQETINWQKLLRVYRNVPELTRESVEIYLQCSTTQAKRYMQAIKLANPFIEKYMRGEIGTDVIGYVDITTSQVYKGYLRMLK